MKKLLSILAFTLLLCGNSYAFLKNNTISNLEKCIKKSSELISYEVRKERCIVKYASKIPSDSIKIINAKLHYSYGALFLQVNFKNVSKDFIITDLDINFSHEVDYGKDKGFLHLEQFENIQNSEWDGWWVEPNQGENINMDIYGYPNKEFTARSDLISSLTTVSNEFKIKLDNIKKNGSKWDSKIVRVLGFEIQ